jgi:uncharacterized protein YlzI (FlbEa/FlbD family)
MITVHRLNGEEIDVNVWLIESIRSTPDTMLVLTNGHLITVQEDRDEVRALCEAAMRRTWGPAGLG